MNRSMRLVAAIALVGVGVPILANADELVTVNYESAPLTGVYPYLPTGLSNSAPLPSATFTGTVTGSVLLDETAPLSASA